MKKTISLLFLTFNLAWLASCGEKSELTVVSSISLNETNLLLSISEEYPLVATIIIENGTEIDPTWTSSNNSIVTVNDTGLVTALSAGNAIVTATAGEKSAQCKITVNAFWSKKANFAGGKRMQAVSFSIGNKGYIGTGASGIYANDPKLKDFWEYDPQSNTWTQKADFAGGNRKQAIGFSIGDKGYIGTGLDENNNRCQDFWEYDPQTNTWTQKADFAGGGRILAVGFSIGNKGYVGTGLGVGDNQDFWEYDPELNVWTRKADFLGKIRYQAVGFSIENKGYIGTGRDEKSWDNDFWEYDPDSNVWTQKADFLGKKRYQAVGFSIGNKGYIGTGSDGTGGSCQDFWEYNPATNAWAQKAKCIGEDRGAAVGFTIGNKSYVGTGYFYNILFGDFWEFSP